MPSMPPPKCHLLKALSALAALSLLGACSSNFDRRWHDNSPVVVEDAANTIEGKWEGHWYSNGYDYFDGMCRAVITPDTTTTPLPTDPAGKRYHVEIQQVYSNLVPRNYSFTLFAGDAREGKSPLTGEKDFGATSDGVWKFEGDAEGRSLYLSYTSVKDYGTITLRRWPAQ